MSIKILLVDDSAAVRQVVRFYLEEQGDLEVCGEAENGNTAIDLAKLLHPEVMILDFAMRGMNGLDTAREIRAIDSDTKIVMFTIHASDRLLRDAQDAGVVSIVSKDGDDSLKALVEQIRQTTKRSTAA